MDAKKLAQRIIDAIGKDNINSVAHCATRLRFVINDKEKINEKILQDDPDILGISNSNGQYQLIIGTGKVNQVYDEVIKLVGTSNNPQEVKEKVNPLMALIKVLSDIFVPLLPALVAGGLLMAINNLLTAKDLFGPQSIVQLFNLKDFADFVNLLASAPFTFLPILVGYSATKRFGGDGYLGAALAAAMVMPSLVSGYDVATVIASGHMPVWNIFGLNIAQAGYQGQVLPILAVSWLLAKFEQWLHKHIPKALDFTFVPLISILTIGLLTFMVVGPSVRYLSDWLTNGLTWLYQTLGGIGTGIFGLFYSPIVISGLHQSFPAIETTLLADIAKTGGDFIFPIACMANIAQAGACMAVFFMTKDTNQKSIASSASLSALLGITEPAIFGINLQLKFPFFCAMVASGIASIFIGFWKVLSQALGSAGVLGFMSIPPKSIPHLLIATVISFVLAFIFTMIVGRKKMPQAEAEIEEPVVGVTEETTTAENTTLYAFCDGKVESLDQVPDDVFASGMMGKGIAILPSDGKLYAPCDAEIQIVQDSLHAYGLKAKTGIEFLLHIGVDTVQLDGQYFKTYVKQGDQVRQGDLICEFDIAKIKEAGYPIDTILIVLDSKGQDVIILENDIDIKHDDILIDIA